MANDIQRRLRRAKDSERKFAKWLVLHDGPHPMFRPGGGIATSTGRVGHITGLQFDCISMTYAGENKQQVVWAGLWKFWKQIVDKAEEQHLEPVLRIEPTNPDKGRYPDLHIITEARHEQLLGYEHQVKAAAMVAGDPFVNAQGGIKPRSYSKADQTSRSPGAAKRRR